MNKKTNQCPINGCDELREGRAILCPEHLALIPTELRRRIANGSPASESTRMAIQSAIEDVEQQLSFAQVGIAKALRQGGKAMGKASKIEWTDHTFNPWRGCTHKQDGGVMHEACRHCYAETMAKRNPKVLGEWGEEGTRVVASEEMWGAPLKWDKQAAADGVRRRVFCASLADVFEDWQGAVVGPRGGVIHNGKDWGSALPWIEQHGIFIGKSRTTLDDVRRRLFSLVDDTPHLDWLLLTKRPENVRQMLPDYSYHACVTGDCPHNDHRDCVRDTQFRDNVWIGTSISDQRTADLYIPRLLKLRDLAPVLFLSVEPLLGPVDLTAVRDIPGELRDCLRGEWSRDVSETVRGRVYESGAPRIDWVIVGGESGPHARPCNVNWIRSLRDQAAAAGVPCFIKQLGSYATDVEGATEKTKEPDMIRGLADAKGGDWDQWQGEISDLRVREFPEVAHAS